MRQREMGRVQLLFPENLCCATAQLQLRLAQGVVEHLHVVPGDAVAQSCSQRLQECLLGGEAGGIARGGILACAAAFTLLLGEEPGDQRQIALIQETPETGDSNGVYADAGDHEYLISSTMSRTARSSPTSTALEMMEWPMLYSSMPPMAASALMLK